MGSCSYNNLEKGKNVFVYGSLLADEVVETLLNRLPPSSPAILNSYQRFSIKGRVYPAILPVSVPDLVPVQQKQQEEGMKVLGRVLFHITHAELDILDRFEDVEYQRQTVQVSLTTDGHETLQAETYVWCNQNDPNLYGEWNFQDWETIHMKDFTKMTKEFTQQLDLPQSKPRVTTYESFYGQSQDNHE